jgi:hypothetical protein
VADEAIEVGGGAGEGGKQACGVSNVGGFDGEGGGALDDETQEVDLVLERARGFVQAGDASLPGLPGVIAMLEGVGIAGRSARAACWGFLVRSGWQRGLMGLVIHREVSFPGSSPNTPPAI